MGKANPLTRRLMCKCLLMNWDRKSLVGKCPLMAPFSLCYLPRKLEMLPSIMGYSLFEHILVPWLTNKQSFVSLSLEPSVPYVQRE